MWVEAKVGEDQMAKIIGNLVPADDFTHPLGPELNFNESMYFNFHDPLRQVGGFVRLGNRANERRAEMTVTLYLPDGRVYFMFKRPEITHNDAFDAGGLKFEVLEPTQRLRTHYRGSMLEMARPREMADPKRAFTENPLRRVEIDLEHDAVGPIYGHSQDESEQNRDAENQFARAHYEQHMRIRGRIEIEGTPAIEIDGLGLRDHSWGPRHWQAIEGYEWLTMNFGADLGLMVSVIRRGDDQTRRGGVMIRAGHLEPLVEATVEIDWEEGTPFHRALCVHARTAAGESLEITGRVLGFIPLRNRRGGTTTTIGEGLTEWRLGEQVGYGLSELLRTEPAG